MAGVTVQLTAKKQISLQEIFENINSIEDAELVSKSEQSIHDVIIWTLVYEKYFFRTGSYSSIAVVLTEHGDEQTACVVSSGGGEGLVNYSLGANRNFAKACVRILESCGFAVVNSDLNAPGKGLIERIFD